jgi:hypothetical protein
LAVIALEPSFPATNGVYLYWKQSSNEIFAIVSEKAITANRPLQIWPLMSVLFAQFFSVPQMEVWGADFFVVSGDASVKAYLSPTGFVRSPHKKEMKWQRSSKLDMPS